MITNIMSAILGSLITILLWFIWLEIDLFKTERRNQKLKIERAIEKNEREITYFVNKFVRLGDSVGNIENELSNIKEKIEELKRRKLDENKRTD